MGPNWVVGVEGRFFRENAKGRKIRVNQDIREEHEAEMPARHDWTGRPGGASEDGESAACVGM
jgi:hypothetical protein